jgi:hypothetical protein
MPSLEAERLLRIARRDLLRIWLRLWNRIRPLK